MIVDNPQSHFIFIYPSSINLGHPIYTYKGKQLTNKEYLKHWGKWVILGSREELDKLAKALDSSIEQGAIPCAKYDRSPQTELGLNECVMCVYCDDREKEKVWEILSSLGVEQKAWVYDRESIEMWSPGGILLERWIAVNCKSEEEAEEVRKDAYLRFKNLYEKEDEPFYGWG